MIKKIIENINSLTKQGKAALFLLSLIMATLYLGLVINGLEQKLVDFKQMVPLPSNEASLILPLHASRYQLKIKHKISEGQSKKIFFNDDELRASRVRKKKVIETDYFYIEANQIKQENILKVRFGTVFPSDIDVRLSNYIIVPNENLSYDLYILFKNNLQSRNFTAIRFLSIFFFFLCFFILVCFFLVQHIQRPLSYISLAAGPFVFLSGIVMLNNQLPFIPYLISVTPFLFWTAFFLSFFLLLEFTVPKDGYQGDKYNEKKK